MSTIRVFAPASVSNVGPGFDIMGFALKRPGDTVEAWLDDTGRLSLDAITGDGGRLPLDAETNAATAAAASVWRAVAMRGGSHPLPGIRMRLHKGLPLQSGLGSSGASAAAGAVAANELLGRPFTPTELVPHAMAGESVACGSAHADNVAPSMLGGFVIVRSYDPLEIIQLPVPPGLHVAVVHPHCEVSTRHARELLMRRQFAIGDIVSNVGNAAAMVVGLFRGDLPLIGRCVDDRLVEPVRADLIPGFAAARQAAFETGVLGFSISGSGPTVFAFARGEDMAARAADSIAAAFRIHVGLDSDTWFGPVGAPGAHVVGA